MSNQFSVLGNNFTKSPFILFRLHPEMSHCSTFFFVLLEVYDNRRFPTVGTLPQDFFHHMNQDLILVPG